MIIVIKTKCFPKEYTLSRDGKTPINNGDWSLWFNNRGDAEKKAIELRRKDESS